MSPSKSNRRSRFIRSTVIAFLMAYAILSAGLVYHADERDAGRLVDLTPAGGKTIEYDYPIRIFSADIDGDGDDELIVANSKDGNLSVVAPSNGVVLARTSLKNGIVDAVIVGDSASASASASAETAATDMVLLTDNGTICKLSIHSDQAGVRFEKKMCARLSKTTTAITILDHEDVCFLLAVDPAARTVRRATVADLGRGETITLDHVGYGIAVVDVNADRIPDLVLYDLVDSDGFLYLDGANLTAMFAGQLAPEVVFVPTNSRVTHMVQVAIGPERTVVCTVNYNRGSISVFNTTIDGPRWYDDFTVGKKPYRARSFDLDSDGVEEIVFVDFEMHTLSIFSFENEALLSFGTGRRPIDLAVGGFNGDGVVDCAVSNKLSGDLSLILSRPSTAGPSMGRLYFYRAVDVYGPDINIDHVVWTELDGNAAILYSNLKRRELWVAHLESGAKRLIRRGVGRLRFAVGNFTERVEPEIMLWDEELESIELLVWDNATATFTTVADLTAEGDRTLLIGADLIPGGADELCTIGFENGGVRVRIVAAVSVPTAVNENAQYVLQRDESHYRVALSALARVEMCDIDNDGDIDIVLYDPNGYIYTLSNTGEGTFEAAVQIDVQ